MCTVNTDNKYISRRSSLFEQSCTYAIAMYHWMFTSLKKKAIGYMLPDNSIKEQNTNNTTGKTWQMYLKTGTALVMERELKMPWSGVIVLIFSLSTDWSTF